MFKLARIFTLLLFLCLFITGCTPCDENNERCIRIPESDNTLPTEASLNLTEEVADQLLRLIYVDQISSPNHIPTIQPSGNLIIASAHAEDLNGGVKSIQLWMQKELCRTIIVDGEELAECAGPGLLAGPRVQKNSDALVGEFTLKERTLIHFINLEEELGNRYTSLNLEVWVKVENFYGGEIETPKVTISYP